jgi:hypothetical protein
MSSFPLTFIFFKMVIAPPTRPVLQLNPQVPPDALEVLAMPAFLTPWRCTYLAGVTETEMSIDFWVCTSGSI